MRPFVLPDASEMSTPLPGVLILTFSTVKVARAKEVEKGERSVHRKRLDSGTELSNGMTQSRLSVHSTLFFFFLQTVCPLDSLSAAGISA